MILSEEEACAIPTARADHDWDIAPSVPTPPLQMVHESAPICTAITCHGLATPLARRTRCGAAQQQLSKPHSLMGLRKWGCTAQLHTRQLVDLGTAHPQGLPNGWSMGLGSSRWLPIRAPPVPCACATQVANSTFAHYSQRRPC